MCDINNMTEWRPLKESPLNYEISTTGLVRSIGFSNQWGHFRRKRPLLLAQIPSANGYLQVSLHINGVGKPFMVHRLMASNFLGKVEGKVINHKDGNKKNNNINNLEICTI